MTSDQLTLQRAAENLLHDYYGNHESAMCYCDKIITENGPMADDYQIIRDIILVKQSVYAQKIRERTEL